MPEKAKYLNLGCGGRYHPEWTNIDIAPQSKEVMQYDLSRGIPFPDASCDVVYHAAVFEHLRRPDAAAYLKECFRVLQPGGIVRIGVPDLEKICRLYLSKLEAASNGDPAAAFDYDWIMLELFDQTVREKSGGEMLDYLRQDPLPNEAFVYERIGEEGRQLIKTLRNRPVYPQKGSLSLSNFLNKLKKGMLSRLLGKKNKKALEIGRFRLAGEVHQWMYDRYSLSKLLMQAGFRNPQLQSASTSQIPNWTNFNLDTLPDGTIIKPDLFFMEAVKPGKAIL